MSTSSPVRLGVRKIRQELRAVFEPMELRKRTQTYERDRAEREARYRDSFKPSGDYEDVVNTLERDGYARVPGVIDAALIDALKTDMESKLDSGEGLSKVSNDTARKPGDQSAAEVFLSEEELKKGQGYFRALTNYASVQEPLLNAPGCIPLAFHEMLIDIAHGYLNCFPALGGLNLRKSFVNDIPAFDTQFFHFDQNSPRLLKFFMYLNDVDMDTGPFCFVKGSHTKRFRGHTKKHRWTVDEIKRAYGEENFAYLTGNVGDLLIADTSGCHRGTELTKHDRRMLTINYVIHPEFEGRQKPFKIRKTDVEALTPKQQAAADFLETV